MSRTVDQKVVQMQFDNSQFEQGAKQSMSTLDKLKQALHFDGANKGVEDLNNSIKKIDFSQAEIAATRAGFHIQDVWLKISNVLEYNIARKIVSIGESMAKSLTVDQVSAGFHEYELKMGSIQTIMAGTGEKLEVVNKYLNELNEYSDKTIYSFSDMTQNIGKFTNAGVKLGDAVAAIQGVANVAAVSGANAQEASRAMYNFAQALSAGYVKLIDWKSIENANMATVEFKDTLLQTAVALGYAKEDGKGYYQVLTKNAQGKTMDGVINATKNFNDSLAYQWMKTDVLTQALEIYSKDVRTMTDAEKAAYEEKLRGHGFTDKQIEQFEELGIKATKAASEVKTFSQLMDTIKESIGSGWAMSFEHIIGNFEEAKELFTRVNDAVGVVIAQIDNKRNAMLENWKNLPIGGRKDLIEAFANLGKALMEWATPIVQVLREIFGTMDSRKLADMVKTFKDWTESIRLNKEQQENLRIALHYLLTPLKVVVEIVKFLVKLIPPLITIGVDLIQIIVGISGVFAMLLRQQILKHAKDINRVLGELKKIATTVLGAIKNLVVQGFNYLNKALKDSNSWLNKTIGFLKTLGGITLIGIRTAFQSLANFKFSNITDGLDKMKTKLKDMGQNSKVIKFFIDAIGKLKAAFTVVGEAFGVFFDGLRARLEKAQSFGEFLQAIWDSLKDGYNFLKDFIESKFFTDGPGLFDTIKTAFSDFVNVLTGGMEKIPWAKLILIGFTVALAACTINLVTAISRFGGLAMALKETIGIINQTIKTITGLRNRLIELKEIAIFITAITAAIGVLSYVEKENGNLTQVAITLGALAAGLMILAEAMLWINTKNAFAPASLASLMISLGGLAAGTAILVAAVSALKDMSMSLETALPYIKTLSVLMLEMLGVMTVLTLVGRDHKIFTTGAMSIIAYAGSVYILANALGKLAQIDFPRIDDLLKVLAGVFAGFVAVSVTTSKISKTDSFLFDGGGGIVKFLAFAASLKLIASALSDFSQLNLSESAKYFLDTLVDFVKYFGTILVAAITFKKIFSKTSLEMVKLKRDFSGFKTVTNGFAISLLSIAASFFIITKTFEALKENLKSADDRGMFAATLGVFALSIVALGFVFKAFAKTASTMPSKNAITKFAVTLALLTTALLPLSLVFDLLAGIAKNNSVGDLIIAGAFMAAVGLVMAELMKAAGQLKLTSFKSILAIFASFSLVIAELVAITLLLDKHGVQMIEAMAVLGTIGLGMAKLIDILSKMDVKNIQVKPILAVVGSLVVLAGVLVGLTFLMDKGIAVLGALGTMAAIAVILVGVMAGFALIKKKLGEVGSVITPLITIVGSMTVMIGVLVGLALLIEKHGESIKSALITMGAIGLGLVAVYGILAAINEFSGGLGNFASLLSFGAVIAVVAGGLWLLSQVPWQALAAAGGVVAVFTLVMVGLAAALGVINLAIPGSVLVFNSFATAIGILVAAFALLVAASALFIKSVTGVVNAITELGTNGDQVAEGLKKVKDQVVVAINDISTALMQAGPKLGAAATQIMIGISNGIYQGAPMIAAGIAQAANMLIPVISMAIVEISKALGEGIQYILSGILNSFVQFFDAGSNLVGAFGDGFSSGQSFVEFAGQALIQSLINILLGPLGTFFNIGALIKNAFLSGATPTEGDMKVVTQSYEMETAGAMFGIQQGTVKTLTQTQKKAKDEASKIPTSAVQGIKQAADKGSKTAADSMNKINDAVYAGWDNMGRRYQTSVAPWITKFTSDIGQNGLVGSIKNAATEGWSALKSHLFDFSIPGFDDLTENIKNATGAMEDFTPAATGAGEAAEAAGNKAKKGAKSAKEAADEVSKFVEKMEGSFNILDEFKLDEGDEENPLTGSKLLSNMRSNVDGMVKWSHEMASLGDKVAQGLYKKLADMGPQGYKYVHALTQMTAEELQEVNQLYATSLVIPTSVTAEIYQGMNLAAGNAYTGFANGLHIEGFQTLGINLATGFLTGLTDPAGLDTHSPSKKTYAIGTYATQGLSNGLKDPSAKEGLYYTVSNMCREIIQKFRLGLSAQNFKDIGQQVLRGLNNGINSKDPDVLKSVTNLCEAIDQRARRTLKIESPSKVFAKIGEYIDLGLAQGISDNVSAVETSADRMAQATIDNMRDAISTIQAVVDSDLDVEPVIRPVVDTSNMSNLDSLMSSTFGTNVNMPQASFMQTSNLISNTDNTNVVEAVNALQNDVIGLKDAMTNIKMVLDTGTMVGAMTPAIDQELGMRQVYAGRSM